ncbi:hypothetical protein [Methylotuvimicrobium sp. KM1]|uniref:hypothetical protein n=1 Tax=Methylotuvimicrobium sp. KM1 TaxID=3377707 RepID=UPI0038506617
MTSISYCPRYLIEYLCRNDLATDSESVAVERKCTINEVRQSRCNRLSRMTLRTWNNETK